MSGFVVSTVHIDAVLTAALSLGVEALHAPGADLDAIGQQILDANVAAWNAAGTAGEPATAAPAYRFAALDGTIDAPAAFKIAQCLGYQLHGAPGWDGSDAHRVIEELSARAVAAAGVTAAAMQTLPRYSAAPWHVSDRDAFKAAPRDGDALYRASGNRRRSAALRQPGATPRLVTPHD